MNINVHIERLILDGLSATSAQGPAVGAAVEAELARLLVNQGLPRVSAGAVPFLSGGPIQLASDSKPVPLGHQIAQAIYSSLTPTPALTRETRFSGALHR